MNVSNVNQSVLSTKNDPDCFRIARTRFEVNNSYMDFINEFFNHKEVKADEYEIAIKNDKCNY
jgi:hypothetical protein